PERPRASARRLILPLALAQFICSFAGSTMNVMIADISDDLDTSVTGAQTAITLFLLIIAILMIPCSKLTDRWGRKPCVMTALSPVGMFFVVFGILQAGTNNVLFVVCLVVGLVFLAGFFLYIRRRERAGKEALLSTGLFRNRTCNLALVTQNIQWLLLMGISFVVSVFLQEVRGYNAIQTGVVFTAATVGILLSSFAQQRLAKRFAQRTLIIAGFVVTLAGIGILLAFVHTSSRVVAFVPGLFLIGLGVGAMLTPSVNVVQSSFPEKLQGEISGLSRAVSNLGPSFGTAIAGSTLPSLVSLGTPSYPLSLIVLIGIGLLGLVAALRLPAGIERATG